MTSRPRLRPRSTPSIKRPAADEAKEVKERLFLRLEGDPADAPGSGVPRGVMRDFPVPPALAEFVGSVIAYREAIPSGLEVIERVLPDGAVRLIVDFGGAGGSSDFRMLAAGASVAPAVLRLQGKLEGVSLALRPGAAGAVLGMPANELAGQAVSLQALWHGQEAHLLERLAKADDACRVRLLLEILQRRLRIQEAGAGDLGRRQATAAARLIARTGGERALRQAAKAIGVGERRFQQVFRQHVGLSPVQWSRLARLHGCLRALREQPDIRWAQVAASCGFYDQSHLVNEFKALCGVTPGVFRERFASDSSKTGVVG